MSDSDGDIGAFLAGFVIGGLVGAATALLLAPQSGAETRAEIASKGDEVRRASERQFLDYRDKAETAVTQTQTKIQETSGQVQEHARIVLDEGKSILQKETTTEADTDVEDDGQGAGEPTGEVEA
ncbi:MAG: YtxH domain-containing protein [Chloroflexota bacterium]